MSGQPGRRFPPDAAVVAAVRSYAADRLRAAGLGALQDDVQLLLTELVTNVILHARTDFEVRLAPVGAGVRVEVADGSPTMPAAGTLAPGALSGRGLALVQSMATRWGARHDAGGGKTVWFEVLPGVVHAPPDGNVDALLAMWDDSADYPSAERSGALVDVVVPDLPVRPLVAAKAHMEDLLREVQLVLLGHDRHSSPIPDRPVLVDIGRRLVEAADGFAEGRRQVRLHALEAAARGEDTVTLHLHLPREAAAAAVRYGEAVREAENLGAAGGLLVTAEHIAEHAEIRRRYLDAILEQLGATAPADRPRPVV